jgi:hypothetical protein
MAKYTQEQVGYAKTNLCRWLKPNTIIYTKLNHASKSGMSRSISLYVVCKKELIDLTYSAAVVMGDAIDNKNGGIKIGGCGMDMGFALVYNLGRTHWPKGTKKPHGTRNGEPDSDGGYALKQRWL